MSNQVVNMGTVPIEDRVNVAIDLSEMWHGREIRRDGTLYIEHPKRVAQILVDYGYDDDITQSEAHLHDVIEMTHNYELAMRRLEEIYIALGEEIGHGVYILSDNTVDFGVLTRRDEFHNRLLKSRDDIKRVKVADFMDNSRDIHIYGPFARARRINEGFDFYIPMAKDVAPEMAKELIDMMEDAKIKYLK